MKILIAMMVAVVAGCAGMGAADRHETARIGVLGPFDVMPLKLAGVHEGDLASREPSRLDGGHGRALALQARLDRAFDAALAQHVRLRSDAPLTIVPTLTLAGTAGFEGLAPETADALLDVKLVDRAGAVVDEVTLRGVADAPLGRERSRDERLAAAVTRLADRYAARLARR